MARAPKEPRAAKPERVRAVDQGVPEDAWRRVHPISPILETWQVIVALIAILTWQNVDGILQLVQNDFVRSHLLWIVGGVLGAILAVALIAGLYSYFAWKRTSWAVTEDAVWMRKGIFARQQRHARLDRVQAVDIVHPLLGRIFGLGALNIEVAGGADSSVEVKFLRNADLTSARNEILARAAGLKAAERGQARAARPGAAPTVTGVVLGDGSTQNPTTPVLPVPDRLAIPTGDAPVEAPLLFEEAPETEVYKLGTDRLVKSLLRSGTFLFSLAWLVAFAVGIVAFLIFAFRNSAGIGGFASLIAIVPAVLVPITLLWGRFAGEFNFRAAVSPDGIRVRRGLTEVRAQTIPPRRVHAVRIEQPWLWRGPDWYRVSILQAGYGVSSDGDSSSTTASHILLPVGTRAEARTALWMVVADLGVEDPDAWLSEAIGPEDRAPHFTHNPDQAKVFNWFTWRRNAVALTATCFATRTGWLNRSVSIAPLERMQSMLVEQGPLARRRDLASLKMEMVPGQVHVATTNMDAPTALQVTRDLLANARNRVAAEPPEHWMLRVADSVDATDAGAATEIRESAEALDADADAADVAPVQPAAPAPAPAESFAPPVDGGDDRDA